MPRNIYSQLYGKGSSSELQPDHIVHGNFSAVKGECMASLINMPGYDYADCDDRSHLPFLSIAGHKASKSCRTIVARQTILIPKDPCKRITSIFELVPYITVYALCYCAPRCAR
jgi:hypothetical protein